MLRACTNFIQAGWLLCRCGVICVLASQSLAEVTAVGEVGFVSEHGLTLASTPDRAYQALTHDIAAWWDPAHSYSGSAANFSLDPVAGGCFCERLADGGSVEHMRVVFAAPGATLRLQGGLGPLQAMGVQGVMEFRLEAAQRGTTRLEYRYSVNGFVPGGLGAMAEPVDQVQLGQLQRLAEYLRGVSD